MFMVIRRDARDSVEASVVIINLVVICYTYFLRKSDSKALDTHHQTINFE